METAISDDVRSPDYCVACEGICGPEFTTSLECGAEHAYCEGTGAEDVEIDGVTYCGACGQAW
jgi:hypothetical protein